MKNKIIPCSKYVCMGADCLGGKKEVTIQKCQHCKDYRPRKTGNIREESVKSKKNKIIKKDLAKQLKDQC